MSSDNAQSAVTYTSIPSDSDGPSWGIPLMNAGELPEMDPYEEVAQQGQVHPLSPAYVPDPIELDEHVPVYVPEPQHPEYHAPSDDDIQVEDDDEDPEEDPNKEHESKGSEETELFEEDEIAITPPPSRHHGARISVRPQTPMAASTQALIDAFASGSSPRFAFTGSLPGCDVAESSAAAVVRAPRSQYDFVDTVEAGQSLIRSPGHDTWTIARAADRAKDASYVRRQESENFYTQLLDAQTDRRDIRLEIDVVRGMSSDVGCSLAIENSSSEAQNRKLLARLETLETHMSRMKWQCQSTEDLVVTQMMHIHTLEARARADTVEDADSGFIENGNTPPITQVVEGVETIIAPATTEEKAQKRECKALRSQDTKHKESTKRIVPVETPALVDLVSYDGLGGYDWSDQAEDGPTNFALMAYPSTSSNSEVSTDSNCSSSCLENNKILKEQNEQLLKDLRTSKINAITYKIGLDYVEARLLVYKKNESVYEKDIKILKYLSGLEEFVNEPIVTEPTVKKPSVKTNEAKANSEDEAKSKSKIKKETVKPSFAKIMFVKSKEQVKSPRKTTVKQVEKPRKNTNRPRGYRRNWNNMMSQRLGNYEEIDGGYVAFGGNPKGGKITGRDFKDKTSAILKTSITGIENLVDHKVKVIRCDNGTEFKNMEMNQFFEMKEYSTIEKRIVEENLHTTFSENTLNIAGSGSNWLFNIDTLTKSLNYKPVVAGNQSNGNAGTKACDDVGKARMETVHGIDYILLPLWTTDPLISQESKSSQDGKFQPLSDDGKKVNEDQRQENKCKDKEKEDNVNNTNNLNVVGTNKVNVVGANINNEHPFDPEMPALEDISTFNFSSDHEDYDEEADMNNIDTTIQVSHAPTIRIHKDHHLDQVIGDLHSTTQTRHMSKNLEEHGFVTIIYQRTNHKDLQNYLFACFLSQKEPRKVIHALKDPSWIESIHEELLQFKLQEV
nr:hypothetical protein [Tanacetum cinerariifolium]